MLKIIDQLATVLLPLKEIHTGNVPKVRIDILQLNFFTIQNTYKITIHKKIT